MPVKSDVLRRIAGAEFDKLFPETDPRIRDDLITAIVRQWITCAGCAGIYTVAMNYWLHFEEFPDDRLLVRTDANSALDLRQLLRNRCARAEDIPRILRQLTLRQTVVFESEGDVTLVARVDSHLRRFEIGAVDPEE